MLCVRVPLSEGRGMFMEIHWPVKNQATAWHLRIFACKKTFPAGRKISKKILTKRERCAIIICVGRPGALAMTAGPAGSRHNQYAGMAELADALDSGDVTLVTTSDLEVPRPRRDRSV